MMWIDLNWFWVGSIKGRKILEHVNDHQLLKKDTAS